MKTKKVVFAVLAVIAGVALVLVVTSCAPGTKMLITRSNCSELLGKWNGERSEMSQKSWHGEFATEIHFLESNNGLLSGLITFRSPSGGGIGLPFKASETADGELLVTVGPPTALTILKLKLYVDAQGEKVLEGEWKHGLTGGWLRLKKVS